MVIFTGAMNRYFTHLIDICENRRINELQILDKDNRLAYGLPCVPHVIGFDIKKQKWFSRIIDTSRGAICENEYCDNEREACISFIKMSEKWFHLSSHLAEFEA